MKAKDSDDEDYMVWKKPDVTAPIVTFTPPPDDATPSTSFRYKPNVLTKKQLESFNVRQNQQMLARVLADGDDGFESLNGYNSNGSEGERVKHETENLIQREAKRTNEQNNEPKENNSPDKSAETSAETAKNEETIKNNDETGNLKKVDDKSDADSDGVAATSSPSTGKRVGVRFRNSWAQDGIRLQETSDEDFTVHKKKEKVIFIQFSPFRMLSFLIVSES